MIHKRLSTNDIQAALAAVPLLSALPDESLAELSRLLRERRAPQGSILFLEGDPGDEAFIVLSGRIDLTVTSLDGNELMLARIGPGGYFGELALLDGKPRSATATAAEESLLMSVRREQFLDFLRSDPDAAVRLLRFTSERLRLADEKIKALGFKDVAGRLAQAILELDEEKSGIDGVSVHHDQLAALIGSRRPTVTSLLSQWRGAGYIETGRGRIVVVDRPALEELASL